MLSGILQSSGKKMGRQRWKKKKMTSSGAGLPDDLLDEKAKNILFFGCQMNYETCDGLAYWLIMLIKRNLLFDIINPIVKRCLNDVSRVPRVGDRSKRHLKVPNYGYTLNLHTPGETLPRIKGCTQKIPEQPDYSPDPSHKRPWDKEHALLGQNDYIDLFTDNKVHPAQLLYHVPPWLRGFPGDQKANELIRLIHYRNLYNQKLKRNSPRRWHELMKQIQFLLKYHNYRKQDEMRLERQLGIWKDEPDYFYKDKELRSYKDFV
uniref:Large ribosomal subunit protein mL51 n=1 Tax=Romanomermis culicivorax TaxID=13658 RepID=A0A915KK98_ROMCU